MIASKKSRRVEILNIEHPFSFWIAESKSKSFLDLIHEEITKCSTALKTGFKCNADLIAVLKPHDTMFYRAQALNILQPNLSCFLVDTGETVNCRFNDCKHINNLKLKELAPLAKHCKLYGIRPFDTNTVVTGYNFVQIK
jgi:hypothetical protein